MFVGGKSCIDWSDERDSILLLVDDNSWNRRIGMTEVMKMRYMNCDCSDSLADFNTRSGIA